MRGDCLCREGLTKSLNALRTVEAIHLQMQKEEMEIEFCSAGPELEAQGRTHGLMSRQIQKLSLVAACTAMCMRTCCQQWHHSSTFQNHSLGWDWGKSEGSLEVLEFSGEDMTVPGDTGPL